MWLDFQLFPSILLNFTSHFATASSVTCSEIRQNFSKSVIGRNCVAWQLKVWTPAILPEDRQYSKSKLAAMSSACLVWPHPPFTCMLVSDLVGGGGRVSLCVCHKVSRYGGGGGRFARQKNVQKYVARINRDPLTEWANTWVLAGKWLYSRVDRFSFFCEF